MDNENRFFISLKDVADDLKQCSSDLRTIVVKFEAATKVDEDHEKRIRFIEKWLYAIPPTIVATVVTAYFQFFQK